MPGIPPALEDRLRAAIFVQLSGGAVPVYATRIRWLPDEEDRQDLCGFLCPELGRALVRKGWHATGRCILLIRWVGAAGGLIRRIYPGPTPLSSAPGAAAEARRAVEAAASRPLAPEHGGVRFLLIPELRLLWGTPAP